MWVPLVANTVEHRWQVRSNCTRFAVQLRRATADWVLVYTLLYKTWTLAFLPCPCCSWPVPAINSVSDEGKPWWQVGASGANREEGKGSGGAGTGTSSVRSLAMLCERATDVLGQANKLKLVGWMYSKVSHLIGLSYSDTPVTTTLLPSITDEASCR